ncbi:unnamed protein product [Amoebophrya sp. A120]|nr:unnamed protein product [Amoebophrya sp. A120]|eukprot:GSA120T00006021001.1
MKKQLKTKARPFDWGKQELEKVCVRIAYFGKNYHGLAFQSKENQPTIQPTIEEKIFEAMEKTKLWKSLEEANYSRCGRTDKGVHAAGNYFACLMRKVGQNQSNSSPERTTRSVAANQEAESRIPANNKPDFRIKMLNGVLPKDIRVLQIYPVPDTFDARFSCLFRIYRYFFVTKPTARTTTRASDVTTENSAAQLMHRNLANMEKAANYLVGEHDFRNFCKMDLEQTTNFVRRVLSVSLTAHPQFSGVYQVEIRGMSFLWHQIRCIMTILFLVLEEKEKPEIVLELLDINKHPRKPNYDLADEAGLVLYDCVFDQDSIVRRPSRKTEPSFPMKNHVSLVLPTATTEDEGGATRCVAPSAAETSNKCVKNTTTTTTTTSSSTPSPSTVSTASFNTTPGFIMTSLSGKSVATCLSEENNKNSKACDRDVKSAPEIKLTQKSTPATANTVHGSKVVPNNKFGICPSACVPYLEQATAALRDAAVLQCLSEAAGIAEILEAEESNPSSSLTSGTMTMSSFSRQTLNTASASHQGKFSYTPLLNRSKAPSLEEKLATFDQKSDKKKRDCSTLVNDRDEEKLLKIQKVLAAEQG